MEQGHKNVSDQHRQGSGVDSANVLSGSADFANLSDTLLADTNAQNAHAVIGQVLHSCVGFAHLSIN